MRLYNISGVLIYSQAYTPEELDMQDLPAGMYLLHVGSEVIKVIKSK